MTGEARRMDVPVVLVLLVALSPLLMFIAGARAQSRSGEQTLRVAVRGEERTGTHTRHKRCTCESYLDRECVYYCHLGVIWVNSPERTVPYGVGGSHRDRRSTLGSVDDDEALLQRRAATDRCACSMRSDRPCRLFCRTQEPPPSS
ncbi:endothelin-3-like isoform X1 [Lampetra planeri]